jgi:transcription-repair coupling factor (superfamily II helicase)
MTAIKVETMASLLENPESQVVITCPSALLRHLPLPEHFQAGCITLRTNDEMDMEELKRRCVPAAIHRPPMSISHCPLRQEAASLMSIPSIMTIRSVLNSLIQKIDSIRFFDVLSQKTIETVQEVKIVPASDVIFTDEEIDEIQKKAEELTKGEMPGEIEPDLMSLESHVFDRSMYPYMSLLDHTAGIWDYMQDPLDDLV